MKTNMIIQTSMMMMMTMTMMIITTVTPAVTMMITAASTKMITKKTMRMITATGTMMMMTIMKTVNMVMKTADTAAAETSVAVDHLMVAGLLTTMITVPHPTGVHLAAVGVGMKTVVS